MFQPAWRIVRSRNLRSRIQHVAKSKPKQTWNGFLDWKHWDGRPWNIKEFGIYDKLANALVRRKSDLKAAQNRLENSSCPPRVAYVLRDYYREVVKREEKWLWMIRHNAELQMIKQLISSAPPTIFRRFHTSWLALHQDIYDFRRVMRELRYLTEPIQLALLSPLWSAHNIRRRRLEVGLRAEFAEWESNRKAFRLEAKIRLRVGTAKQGSYTGNNVTHRIAIRTQLMKRSIELWNMEPQFWAAEGPWAVFKVVEKRAQRIYGHVDSYARLDRYRLSILSSDQAFAFRSIARVGNRIAHDILHLVHELTTLRYCRISRMAAVDLTDEIRASKIMFKQIVGHREAVDRTPKTPA